MSWRNVSTVDRTIRAIICLAMFAVGWEGYLPQPWSAALQIFALPGLLTALLGWDPVYALLGISTRRNPSGR